MSPIPKFHAWFSAEKAVTKVRIPAACCLSTLGLDGYPNARFLALKEIVGEAFVITGPMGGRKGQEIAAHAKVSLTFWWTETERQVRIQGEASSINDELADRYFAARREEAKVVSQSFKQGEILTSLDELTDKYEAERANWATQDIPRPANWGGVMIQPLRIEFLDFKESRLHERQLFVKQDGEWSSSFLQP